MKLVARSLVLGLLLAALPAGASAQVPESPDSGAALGRAPRSSRFT